MQTVRHPRDAEPATRESMPRTFGPRGCTCGVRNGAYVNALKFTAPVPIKLSEQVRTRFAVRSDTEVHP